MVSRGVDSQVSPVASKLRIETDVFIALNFQVYFTPFIIIVVTNTTKTPEIYSFKFWRSGVQKHSYRTKIKSRSRVFPGGPVDKISSS